MEEVGTRTLVLPDTRDRDRFLRITWHPGTATVVFSHWTGSICTASTRASLPEASRLIELLAGALRSAAIERPMYGPPSGTAPTRLGRLLDRIRPPRASIVDIGRRYRERVRREVS